jgi:hypothetical protein
MRQLCTTGFTHDPKITNGYLAHTYVFDSGKVRDDAKDAGLTIDQSLTFELAKSFQSNPLNSPLLALLAIRHSQINICICGRNSNVQVPCLTSLPGFYEYGQDIVSTGAIPFMFWNGQHCFRVYDFETFPGDSEHAFQDFGSLVGTFTSQCTKEDFDLIRNDPIYYNDYSAIPKNNEVKLTKRGDSLIITQAFIDLIDKKVS